MKRRSSGSWGQLEGYDFVDIFLFRKVAIDAVVGDARGQALPLVAQLLLVEIPAGFVLCLLARCLVSAWRRLGDREGKRALAGHIHHRQRRNFPPVLRDLRSRSRSARARTSVGRSWE